MSGYNPENLRATIRSAVQEGEAHIRQLERASTHMECTAAVGAVVRVV